jgi:two-component system, OmpR family, alkaline phosphatase synthesis response regulator PhoP
MKANNGNYDILIIDDNEELAGLIKLLLKKSGYKAKYITNSVRAFEKIKKDKPPIVILDLVMPLMDGLRLCDRIKSTPDTAKTKVIIYTGKKYESDRRKALNLGAEAFIIKPTRARLLLNKVRELLTPANEEVYQN